MEKLKEKDINDKNYNFLSYQDNDGTIKTMMFKKGEFHPPTGLAYSSINAQKYLELNIDINKLRSA